MGKRWIGLKSDTEKNDRAKMARVTTVKGKARLLRVPRVSKNSEGSNGSEGSDGS